MQPHSVCERLHFNFHVGSFTYDLHDLDQILRHPDFSWDRAESLWSETSLVSRILPVLAVFTALSAHPTDERWNKLYRGLPPGERVRVAIGLRLLSSRRFTRLRKDWFCTQLTGWPLITPLAARLAGSRATSRTLTGRNEREPIFWLAHLVGLPMRRMLSFWR